MAKEKKFITCDGNEAAAHISYMFSEVAAIYPRRHPLWRNTLTNGPQKDAKTFSDRPCPSRKCNQREAQPEQCTAHSRPAR